MSPDYQITLRFYPPPEDLRRYFTSFYVSEIDPGSNSVLHDSLHPEWGGVRFFSPNAPDTWTDAGQRLDGARFVAQGPSSHPIHFTIPKTRIWGFGLLPLGWAKYVRLPAAHYANSISGDFSDPAFGWMQPLAETLFQDEPDEAGELARLTAFFQSCNRAEPRDAKRILEIHSAMVDPQLTTVQELVDRVSASQRTIERVAKRHFGFSPKLLLRRQRFMRSLAQFMVDPSLNWIGAIDGHYFDQAQFVRDFREFMGISPREYSSQPHPVLERFTQERNKALASAVQTLDRPDGSSNLSA